MAADFDRLGPAHRRGAHPEFPVMRRIVLRDSNARARLVFATRLAIAGLPDVACIVDDDAVALVAASEAELDPAVARLREIHGDDLAIGPPVVRLRCTARGLEAPVMGLQVRCPPNHVERVRRDLRRRGAEIVEASSGAHFGVVRACVALAAVLGYARQLHELTRGSGRSVCWLDRYEPVPEGGDAA